MRLLYISLFIVCSSYPGLFAQVFTQTNISLEPMRYASLDWGDFDSDGDLDLLASGSRYIGEPFTNSDPFTFIYRNEGSGQFTLTDSAITGVESGTAIWGDYNNDGHLDVLVCGRVETTFGYSAVAEIWEKDSTGAFYRTVVLDSLDYPNAAWADINNDGFLDIFLSGNREINNFNIDPVSILLTNDQNGGFFRDDTSLVGVTYGGSDFADYDNDGDFDLIITGLNPASGYLTTLYENQNGQFIQNPSNFLGVLRSKIAWSDIDNDGDMDFVVGGQEGEYPPPGAKCTGMTAVVLQKYH